MHRLRQKSKTPNKIWFYWLREFREAEIRNKNVNIKTIRFSSSYCLDDCYSAQAHPCERIPCRLSALLGSTQKPSGRRQKDVCLSMTPYAEMYRCFSQYTTSERKPKNRVLVVVFSSPPYKASTEKTLTCQGIFFEPSIS